MLSKSKIILPLVFFAIGISLLAARSMGFINEAVSNYSMLALLVIAISTGIYFASGARSRHS